MNKLSFVLLLALVLIGQNIFAQINIGEQVPEEWLKKALEQPSDKSLIIEFGKLFFSEAVSTKSYMYDEKEPLLNLTKINLDNDIESEYLLFIGTNYSETNFYVIDDNLSIIFGEYLYLHNEYPQLRIYNTLDQHKLFGYKFLYGRGSGHWLFSNKVFRVESGKVSLVLEFIDSSNDSFNYAGINGKIETNNIREYGGDIFVKYSYDLYLRYDLIQDLGIEFEGNSYSLFDEDEVTIIYSYDPVTNQLVYNDHNISQEMMEYFFQPSNDSLFLKAFNNKLDEKYSQGSNLDRKLIDYLRRNKN